MVCDEDHVKFLKCVPINVMRGYTRRARGRVEKPKRKEKELPAVTLEEAESTERLLAKFIEAEHSLTERITELIDRSKSAIENSRKIIAKQR